MLKVFLTQRHMCPKKVCIYLVEGRAFGYLPDWGHRVRSGIWKECTSCLHYWDCIKNNKKISFKQEWRPVSLTQILPTYMFSLTLHFQNKTKSFDYFKNSNHASPNYNLFVFTSGQKGSWARVWVKTFFSLSLEVIQISLSPVSLWPFI